MNNLSKLTDTVIANILARLENYELEEAVTSINFDPYGQKILQQLNTPPKTKMTKEQLDRLFDAVVGSTSLHHKTKWANFFYGGILQKQVLLSSFLKYTTNESVFYSNYKYHILNEANVHMTPAEIDGFKIIYIKSPQESTAYVQSKKDPGLYITNMIAGKYETFLKVSTNAVASEERKKLFQFLPSITQKILQDSNLRIASEYANNPELVKAAAGLLTINPPNIILDTISLAFADILNINLQPSFGNQRAAGSALLASPLLSSNLQSNETLFSLTPEISQNIEKKLQEVIGLENPYLVNLELLRQAKKSIRSKNTFYTGFANNLFSTWANLLSYIGKLFGGTIDLHELVINPDGRLKTTAEKKQALFTAVGGSDPKIQYASDKSIPNSFIKLVGVSRKTISGKAYVLDATGVGGYKYNDHEMEWMATSPKIMAIPVEVMARAKEQAIEVGNDSTSGIFNAISKMTKASLSQQNANMGSTTNPQEQLLEILKAVYIPKDNFFSNQVLFAAVPYLLLQCAGKNLDILSTDSYIDIIEDFTPFEMSSEKSNKNELRVILANYGYGGNSGKSDDELYRKYNFRPIADICNEYLDILLDPDHIGNKAEISNNLGPKFIQLIKNLESGMWTNTLLTTSKLFDKQTIAGYNPLTREGGTLRIAVNKLIMAEKIKSDIVKRFVGGN